MFLSIRNINKSFGAEQVLTSLSFELEAGRILSILGRSGCGKTTLLKIVAGLEKADAGGVWLDGKSIDSLPPNERGAVYLYQEPLLFPHLNIFENVAFGLRLRKTPEAEIELRVGQLLEELDLGPHSRKMPHQLSGGAKAAGGLWPGLDHTASAAVARRALWRPRR